MDMIEMSKIQILKIMEILSKIFYFTRSIRMLRAVPPDSSRAM